MPSRSLRQAEETALNGENESQDTLAVAEYLIEKYALGLRSSSPPPEIHTLPSPNRSSARKSRASKLRTRGSVRDVDSINHLQRSHEYSPVAVDTQIRPLPRSKKKMSSSQSSTQSNTGRNYECFFNPSSPGTAIPDTQGQGSPEDGNGGTVQFNFDKMVGNERSTGLFQDDSGFVEAGSVGRSKEQHLQKQSHIPLPETPAPPQNPFRHSRSQLLPTSQLFRATQLSSAIKIASPTSSRPSPAEFPHNNFNSPNLFVSSPLKDRGLRSSSAAIIPSSPQTISRARPSRPIDLASSQDNTTSADGPVIPETSRDDISRQETRPEPMVVDKPRHETQERRSSEDRHNPFGQEDDEDEEDDAESTRRMKVKLKKKAGLKSLSAFSVARTSKSFSRKVAATKPHERPTEAEAYAAQRHGSASPRGYLDGNGKDVAQDPQVKDSELEPLPVPLPTSMVAPAVGDDESTQSDNGEVPDDAVDSAIPTQAPRVTIPQTSSGDQSSREDAATGVTSNGEAIPETSQNRAQPASLETEVPTHKDPAPNFRSSPPTFRTKGTRAKASAQQGSRKVSASSSLSNLESTPVVSPATSTPNSAAGVSPMDTSTAVNTSPAVGGPTRSRKITNAKASTESLRHSSRLVRRLSSSPDALAMPETPAFEQSMRVSRFSTSRSASRSGRVGARLSMTHGGPRLFEGMVFAISFQSKKAGESHDAFSARMEHSATIQRRITEAGGRILENGFDELFVTTPVRSASASPVSSPGSEADSEIALTPMGSSTGFTALIADGHSRKAKYMQALALGLPCIAARWVTACVDRAELVDWSPYLLCAGESSFLGNAIRSRSLVPYDASTARLADIVSRRDRFLQGSRILAVVKKAGESKKMPYVFLARILGASLTRVHNVEEARAQVKAAEDSGRPYDWVYVDGKAVERAIFSAGSANAVNKKRKRVSTGPDKDIGPPPKKIRTLNDELVIQSLILGRLIEEGELQE